MFLFGLDCNVFRAGVDGIVCDRDRQAAGSVPADEHASGARSNGPAADSNSGAPATIGTNVGRLTSVFIGTHKSLTWRSPQ